MNNSLHHVYDVQVFIPASLDTDGDGIVTYSGYTDRRGNVVQGCAAPGLDCIPLEIVNAPVGRAIFSRGNSGVRFTDNDLHGSTFRDFDVSPPGEFWITFPN
jgi:hypothetical protein